MKLSMINPFLRSEAHAEAPHGADGRPATATPEPSGACRTMGSDATIPAAGDIRRFGLPPAALAKLVGMEDAQEDAFALARLAGDKMRDAVGDLRHHEREVTRLREAGRGADPKHLALAEKQLEVARAEVAARRRRHDEAVGQSQAIGAPFQNIETWVRKHAGAGAFRSFESDVAPQFRKGETVQVALERVRSEIAERRAELHRIKSAPLTSAEAKAAIRSEVERLAAAGAPMWAAFWPANRSDLYSSSSNFQVSI